MDSPSSAPKTPESILESNRRWKERNPERVKALSEKRYAESKSEMIASAARKYKARKARAPLEVAIYSLRARAKKEGLPFSIGAEDLFVPATCPALGIPLAFADGRPTASSPSVDKIIPPLGYVPGNVQVISRKANMMKSDATPEELVAFARWILQTFDKQ